MRTVFPNAKAVGAFGILMFMAVMVVMALYGINYSTRKSFSVVRDIRKRDQIERQIMSRSRPKNVSIGTSWVTERAKGDEKQNDGKILDFEDTEDRLSSKSVKSDRKSDDVTEEKAVVNVPESPIEAEEDARRREKVVEMIRHSWDNYRNISWGYNELKPLSKKSHSHPIFGGEKMMATIADGTDTLWIAGLKDSYNEARDYIRDHFDIRNAKGTVSVFEVTIRHLAGFLSLYALTKENLYIEKAKNVADALLVAFDTPTGVPKGLVNVASGTASNYAWAGGGASILSELGSLHLEFSYLSEITGDSKYSRKVQKVRDVLDGMEKKDGLYYNYISPETAQFRSEHVSLGAMGDSFYEILLKAWLQTARTDKQAYKMYKEASEAVRKHLLLKSPKDGLTYLAEMRNGELEHKMSHLACFTPGMFALEAAYELDPTRKAIVMNVAEDLASTCHESYIRSETRIGPEMFYFMEGREATSDSEVGYILRPEAIEGWFYLWRITRNKKYKDWVWDAISAIDKYCRVATGFVGLKNVYNPSAGYDDVQQSFFLAETLKYAYLTFTDDVLPLDKWVFNTEAHPIPIMPTNTSSL
ncbi:glycosyl hydrolase family 47 domain-containing protein [Ditylenchus destructor]|uniref:alpha-1,2-Mannosidase n=1 Tax=Ditylenchus destructor TaxID=166010 RepID=A0AAD4N897_9BILA|nr:glycosyl hydrolase family 47 domain-containing protein [Ditylenchus destructor]